MQSRPEWLLDFSENVYSQTGEDGIIKKILEILPDKDKWCVEFGAWDGIHLSNTRNLIERTQYSAVLIEGSQLKYKELKKNYSGHPNVIPINRFVGLSSTDNLDEILKETPIPKNFDFLSVDVDGNDYHLWKGFTNYRPKCVCIEFNSSIPTEVLFIQPPDPNIAHGASLKALVALGKEKGYELISVLPHNAFFVDSQYFPLFNIPHNSPHALRKSFNHITYIFFGYDGSVLLQGKTKLPWHGTRFNQSALQILPKYLRKPTGSYTKFQRAFFKLHKRVRKFLIKLTRD